MTACGFEFNKTFDEDTETVVGTGVEAETESQPDTTTPTETEPASETGTGSEISSEGSDTGRATDSEAILSAELVHRWRFDGELTDEVGDSEASIVAPEGAQGGNATFSDGEIVLAGGDPDYAEYVSLGSHLLTELEGPVSIELFATLLEVRYFSRIFEFGGGQFNYLIMTWTRDTDPSSDGVIWWGGDAMNPVWATNAPYELGTEYHIVMTIDPEGGEDDTLRIAWHTAPSDAATLGEERGSIETSDSFYDLHDVNCWLGKSQSDSDEVAHARYNDVRIWSGILSEGDLERLHQRGPDM